MKNLFFSLSLLLVSACAFGQSVLIEPATATKRFIVKSTGGTYGHFSTSSGSGADLFFKTLATGDGFAGTDIGTISTFNDRIYLGGSINNQLSLGSNGQERMRLALDGKVGIGTFSPNYNLQLHNPSTGTSSILQLTNETIGSTTTDGLYIGVNNFGNASIYNQEGGALRLGANNSAFLALDNEKACLSCLLPVGKFDIWHNTGNTATNPHITLHTTNNASNGMIRMESSTGSRYFGQYFNVNSATAANNFISFDYGGTTPILDMQGNGNVKVSGFTTLGNDASAPKIKMKKLSGTFNANANTSGTPTFIAHGVADPTKIITINVLGQYAGSGGYVSNSFLTSNGYQFDYQIDGVNIIITPKQGNSASLVSQNIKVVLTYEE